MASAWVILAEAPGADQTWVAVAVKRLEKEKTTKRSGVRVAEE